MLVAFTATDKPGALQIRLDNRADHVAYLKSCGVVVHAGPFLDDAGEMCGSLVVIDVPDMAAAQAWADGDPYAQAGLFQSTKLRPWNKVIG
jgi:uncharacterized protein YciI